MKVFKSVFAPISFLILFLISFSSCEKISLTPPWKEKNELLKGKWDVVKYSLDGNDIPAFTKSFTLEFTPSETFPKEGKYETYYKGESQAVQQYVISDDGENILMENEEYELEVEEDMLTLTKNDAKTEFKTLEMVLIRK